MRACMNLDLSMRLQKKERKKKQQLNAVVSHLQKKDLSGRMRSDAQFCWISALAPPPAHYRMRGIGPTTYSAVERFWHRRPIHRYLLAYFLNPTKRLNFISLYIPRGRHNVLELRTRAQTVLFCSRLEKEKKRSLRLLVYKAITQRRHHDLRGLQNNPPSHR